ncbi:MAG TPA: glycosyltransferase family 4 protein [Geobacteraceae bacterium]|nr:glycosyltransferase family 4 protein [Geobacteraceae bacterium]
MEAKTALSKPKIILISPTAGTMAQFERAGFASRQVSLIREYAKYFDVEYYTSDVRDYSKPLQVKHRPLPVRLDVPGLRHLLFWLYLVIRAPFMKGPIRTFGVEIPTLPLIRMLSGQKIIVGFQWDYASTTRANYKGTKRWLANSLQGLGFAGADLVICTADRLKVIAEENYGKKAVVIPNFVDFGLFNKSPEKEDYILYAGRLHWAKGIDVLLSAFKGICAACPGYRLLICGAGEMETSLKETVAREKIENVEFLGSVKQDRLAGLVARAKVFVLPTTTSEGHPKALIEAMASGTACVATRVPGNRDIISDNVNGKLVEPGDADALSKTAISIINDVRMRIELETAGYQSAREFSLQKVIRREAELLKNSLA